MAPLTGITRAATGAPGRIPAALIPAGEEPAAVARRIAQGSAPQMSPADRARRLREYQKLLALGPERLQLRAQIAAENAATAAARRESRAQKAAPIVERMRQNSAGQRPAVQGVLPAAPEATPPGMYLVDRDRAQAILEKATTEGWESLLPDELIVIEDLQAGRARLSGSVERAAETPGDLTEASGEPLDNLEQSATPITEEPKGKGGADNLTPKKAKGPTPAEKLGQDVFQATTATDIESLSGRTAKALQKQVEKMSATPEGRAELIKAMGNPQEAERRLQILQQLSDDFTRDPQAAAAQRIAETADERAASGAVRAPRQSIMEGVGPGLPSVVERFNQLPDAVKADVIRRLDPAAQAIIESGGGVSSISPNALAEIMRPVNEVDGLLATIDDGIRNGMTSETEAARELVRQAPAEQRQAAIAAFRRRQAIDASLRNAMAQAEPSPQTLASPGQPSIRRPGALSPEAAIEDVPTAELPGSFEEALAAQAERAADLERRAPGGGLDESTRKAMAGLSEEDTLRGAPLYLKGRDGRPTPFESRSRGSRGVESNDMRVLKDVIAAREKLSLATTPEEQAAALGALEAAEAALDRKYGKVKQQRGDAFGRPAMSDSRLNSAGQQETYDDLVMAMAGFRPKADRNLNRSNAAMSAADRAAQQDEAVRAFGETDALELLPEPGEIDDVADLGGTGKGSRLGGNQQFSRRAGATDQMFSQRFGGQNPLEMPEFDGDPLKVADEILAKNTIFKPGTANYEMARERIARSVSERFGTQRRGLTGEQPSNVPAQPMGTTQDVSQVPAEQGAWPEGTMRQTAERGPNPRENVAGTPPEQTARTDFSQPATPSTPEEAALEASSVELGDSSPIPEAGKPSAASSPVADSKPVAGRKLTREEIEAEATAAEQEEFARAREDGMPTKKAREAANARRKKVQQELLEANGYIESKPAGAAKPAGAKDKVVDSTPVDPAAGPQKNAKQDTKKTKPDDKKTAPEPKKVEKTSEVEPSKPVDEAGPPKGKDAKTPAKSRLPYYLTGGAILAGVTAANMGGGGGTVVAGGGPIPVPPGGGGVGTDAEMTEEDAINRALAR